MHPEFYMRLNNVTGCKIIEMYANASNNLRKVQKVTGLLPVVDKAVDRGKVENNSDYTDKKEIQIFLIYKEIQSGAVAKSYMTNGLLIYGEIFAQFLIY
jgi:hypothetical protein